MVYFTVWTPRHHLGELERLFVEMERRFDFLQDIDNEIVNSQERFEPKLEHLVNRFALQLVRADAVAICFPTDAGYLVTQLDDTTREELIPVIQQITPAGMRPGKVLFKKISKKIRPNTAALFLPLGTSDQDIFCIVVVLTTKVSPENSHLKDDDIIQYATRVSAQLTVLIETELRMRNTALQSRFIESFFTARLDQTQTLTNCLEAIRTFLPNWEQHKGSNADILVQLLTYQDINQPLTIRAQLQAGNKTANRDLIDRDVGKPVLIEDSVCGELVRSFLKDPTVRILNTDPLTGKYKSLYKAFFGQAIPKSELIAVIAEGNELVGLLNLEHPEAERFSPAYERLLLDAGTRLAPFVRELNTALELDRKRQSAMLYTMFGFLDRLSKTYQHKVNQLTPEIFEPWRTLNKLIGPENTEARQELAALGDKIEAYIDSTKVFVKGAPYYLSKGPIDLKRVVNDAIKEVADPNSKIEFQLDCDGRPEVYASPMLQEHIFNLLRNSQHAIQERLATKAFPPGLVRIEVVTEEIRDHLGNETAGARVQIRIEDNGTGVKQKDLPHIGEYDFSTKGAAGTGYGLPAARDYVRSLGGELVYHNRSEDRGFVVQMFLDLFDKDRHIDETIKPRRSDP